MIKSQENSGKPLEVTPLTGGAAVRCTYTAPTAHLSCSLLKTSEYYICLN